MRYLLALVLSLLIVPIMPIREAGAAIPGTVSYQGVLTDAIGAVVPDNNYSVRFRLYLTDATTVVWEETQSVAVASGRFNVELGSVLSLSSLAFDRPYLLGIKVGTDPELAPLTPLTSVPYSMSARSLVLDPTTRYYSVCAEAFNPDNSNITYIKNTLHVLSTTATFAAFGAPIHLPHGARLVSWRVLFEDTDATQETSVSIRRTNTNNGTFQQLAVLRSGVANAAGQTTVGGATFTDAIIDNDNWAYSLQLSFDGGANANLTLMTVRIAYETTNSLP